MKKMIILFVAAALVFAFCACGDGGDNSSKDPAPVSSADSGNASAQPSGGISSPEAVSETGSVSETGNVSETADISETEPVSAPEEASGAEADDHFTKYDLTTSYDRDDTTIVFDGSSVNIEGIGASADGAFVTVNAPGTYVISGKSSNGQIIVSVQKTEKVRLVLNGLDLTCSKSAPVWVKSADKVVVTLAEGSVNYLTDGKTYIYDNQNNEPNACLFSKDDLTVNGLGSLSVTGKNNNGIGCKNDLKIVSGTIKISAAKNALKGNDSVSIKDAVIEITGCKDGIKTDNAEEADKGYVYIRSGSITVKANDDAIQATNKVTVEGGSITVSAKNSVINCEGEVKVASGVITEK